MNLGPVLRAFMIHREKSIRGLASEIGVDQATLHRFMSGKNPDGKTLATIMRWLLSSAPPLGASAGEKEGKGER